MNRRSSIASDPFRKCAYFVGLIAGPRIDGWVERNLNWLENAEANPTEIPAGMTAWQVMEADFRRSFTDFAAEEKAQDYIRKLKMTEGKVDEYVSAFELLGHRARMNLDDTTAMRLFDRGLP